jgi:hypothetical protein
MMRDGPKRPRRCARARGFQLQRRDLVILSLLVSRRVGSSMVEQRPFKALVVGSSPTQPKGFYLAAKSAKSLWKPFCRRQSTVN